MTEMSQRKKRTDCNAPDGWQPWSFEKRFGKQVVFWVHFCQASHDVDGRKRGEDVGEDRWRRPPRTPLVLAGASRGATYDRTSKKQPTNLRMNI